VLDEQASKAHRQFTEKLVRWQAERDEQQEALQMARLYKGKPNSDTVILNQGESVFLSVTTTSLVEDRKWAGHFQAHSPGFSGPVGPRSRVRSGGSRGHFAQGMPVPTSIDVGTTSITSQRLVFQGAKQTRECLFSKLISFQHSDDGSTVLFVGNRQKPTVVHYGPEMSGTFQFRLDLALAHYRGSLDEFVARIKQELADIDRKRPVESTMWTPRVKIEAPAAPARRAPVATPQPPPAPSTNTQAVAAGWHADPWGMSTLRWFDGGQWTSQVHDGTPAPR
jgi:hypothetical protein